jgi:flagellar basal-body rod protein FlgB
MINAIFNQPSYQAARAMMDVTAKRHEAIASNLSNIEVPNYKRIDVSPQFESALKQAVETGDTQQIQSLRPTLEIDRNATTTNRDGNSVVLEDELLAMNQNTLAHQFETQAVSASLLKLRMAITGRAA